MTVKRYYSPNGDIRRYHASKDRSASRGASPKMREQKRLQRKLRKLRK